MSKTFVYERYDMEVPGSVPDVFVSAEGEYVKAQDAINRDAVLTAQIRTLETQLKDARALIAPTPSTPAPVEISDEQKSLLIEAWNFGQFADDADWPMPKSVRAAICSVCERLPAPHTPPSGGDHKGA